MKRICIVHIISSLKLGGAESVLYMLTKNLDSELFEQHVIFFHDGPLRSKIEALSIHTYQVTGLLYRYDFVFFIKLARLIKKLKPNIINSSLWAANFFGVFSARLLNVPIICTLHTVKSHEGIIRNTLNRLSLPYANHIIAVSNSVKQSFRQLNNIAVITNGILRHEILDKAKSTMVTRAELGINNGDYVIGSVGRFVKVKNYHILLDCAKILINNHSKIKILLVGTGPEEKALIAQAQKLGIQKHVIFVIGRPAYNYYSLFDCFVQPSAHEGLSIALLEALSCNLPCIVTGKNKKHEVIENNKSGLVIEPNNLQELACALKTIYLNRSMQEKFSKNGSAILDTKYKLEDMVNSYSKIFLNNCTKSL